MHIKFWMVGSYTQLIDSWMLKKIILDTISLQFNFDGFEKYSALYEMNRTNSEYTLVIR